MLRLAAAGLVRSHQLTTCAHRYPNDGMTMATSIDNATWLVEAGSAVIDKKARDGPHSLTPWESLVYCLWVADYSMRNAGDLDAARDIRTDFQSEGARIAKFLELPITHASFSLPPSALESDYFARFDALCQEVRTGRLRHSDDR
jgi:hypothetical protein